MTERSEAAEARASAERRAREAELDAGLVARWQAGEREACKELFERYYPNIARFFRTKVRGPGVEEDLVQMTFLRCFEAVSRLREPVAFRSYLFGIACNTLREHYRGARREAELLGAPLSRSVLELAGELGPGPSSLLARREEQRLLLEALRRVPLEHQLLLELRYWERMTGPEMAEVVGAPLGTVKTRLRRARALLEARLRELAETPAALESTLTDLERWAGALRERVT